MKGSMANTSPILTPAADDAIWLAVKYWGGKIVKTDGLGFDDVVQECFGHLLEEYRQAANEPLSAVIARMQAAPSHEIRNKLRSFTSFLHRQQKRRQTVTLFADFRGAMWTHNLPTPDASMSHFEYFNLANLNTALSVLSPREQETIRLYYLSGNNPTFASVAALLVPPDRTWEATKKRIDRAKEKMKNSLVYNYRRALMLQVPIVDVRSGNLLRWYPESNQSEWITDRSFYVGVPNQPRGLHRFYDAYEQMLKEERAKLISNRVLVSDDFIAAPLLEAPKRIHSITGTHGRVPCANPKCKNEIIPYPYDSSCEMCATLKRLNLGTRCPFCITKTEQTELCLKCRQDSEIWYEYWKHRSLANRFRAFQRWDYEARSYAARWALDFTRDGLRRTRHSDIVREVYADWLIVYRNQPVFKFADPTPAPTTIARHVSQAPAVPRSFIATRDTRAVTLGDLDAEDRLHRQKQAMKKWQKQAREAFTSFRKTHSDLNREDALNIYLAARPDRKNLLKQRLCSKCGMFAGDKNKCPNGCIAA